MSADVPDWQPLIPQLRRELQSIAEQHFLAERPGHTLQPTAIAHEVWVYLLEHDDLSFQTIPAFKAWASKAVRNVLVSHARAKGTQKRGGNRTRIPLEGFAEPEGVDLVSLNDALDRLRAEHARSADVVEMRFFGGMSDAEIAHELEVSERTVRNDWALARGWLRRALSECEGEGEHR